MPILMGVFADFILLMNGGLPSLVAADSPMSDVETLPVALFRNFNGSVYLPAPGLSRQLGIGWARVPFYWDVIEPQREKWNFEAADKAVLGAISQEVKVLPMLGYTVGWAKAPGARNTGPVRDVRDWEDFVQQVVARYNRAPFNLRYFQVWNEPTKQAGFWSGETNRDFIDLIYLPAAKVIRRHGCYVVFGGWPISNSLEEFDEILTYHDAWKWTDILDLHYNEVPAWQHLYDKWVKTGKCRGLWQTEVGASDGPFLLPRLYVESLHFALEADWHDPNQYKLFWYADWGAGPDANKCLTMTGPGNRIVLAPQGKRMAVLNELLGGGPLRDFKDFTFTMTAAPGKASAKTYGFRVGDRHWVMALILDGLEADHRPEVLLRMRLGARPNHIELVTPLGQRRPMSAEYHGDAAQVLIQTSDAPTDVLTSARQVYFLQMDAD
jgi:hypothetical protein